jgi:hypothetical protein
LLTDFATIGDSCAQDEYRYRAKLGFGMGDGTLELNVEGADINEARRGGSNETKQGIEN